MHSDSLVTHSVNAVNRCTSYCQAIATCDACVVVVAIRRYVASCQHDILSSFIHTVHL